MNLQIDLTYCDTILRHLKLHWCAGNSATYALLPKIYCLHSERKKNSIELTFNVLKKSIILPKTKMENFYFTIQCNGFIPLATLISAYFGIYFHCTVEWVDTFQRCDIISPKYFYIDRRQKTDRKWFEYHNGINVTKSSAIRLGALIVIG